MKYLILGDAPIYVDQPPQPRKNKKKYKQFLAHLTILYMHGIKAGKEDLCLLPGTSTNAKISRHQRGYLVQTEHPYPSKPFQQTEHVNQRPVVLVSITLGTPISPVPIQPYSSLPCQLGFILLRVVKLYRLVLV